MSTLTIQIGQCGNQLGSALFDSLSSHTQGLRREVFFDAKDRARAVLIDMEPKVVDRCLATKSHGWSYDPMCAFTQQSGAGNNWAFGYSYFGPLVEEEIAERIRRQVERADRTDAVIVLKSTAGGTGSGVGAFIQRMIRDNWCKFPLLTVELWPFVQGEVCVQTYNTALSLAASQEFSDLVVAFENSTMEDIVRNRFSIAKPSFSDINALVASHIAHQLIPSSGGTSGIISHMSCMPEYKIATARLSPQSAAVNFDTDQWRGIFQGLSSMLASGKVMDFDRSRATAVSNKVLTMNLCVRGSLPDIDLKTVFKNKNLFCDFAVDPFRAIADRQTTFNGHNKSCSSWSVDQHPVEMMDIMYNKGKEMIRNNAFVHLYEKHNISKADLVDAMLTMKDTVRRYQALSDI
jgi:tubulin delta